ncbi:Galactoside 2-alpha-L-fucosyltransferase 1 [Lamellibrachia satsuma]|nr:Galactoside 2-alpha-L-fucosyltransferase 1 [Lamellibrachia satsuma]
MPYTVTRGRVLFMLLLVATAAFCFVSYLSTHKVLSVHPLPQFSAEDRSTIIRLDDGVNASFDTEQSDPLPDAQHPIVTLNSVGCLNTLTREMDDMLLGKLKSRGIVQCRDRPIVLRYRSNTSTILKSRPDAGRMSAIFMGRTGNNMYIFAGLYGIARRNGFHPVISAYNPLLTLFQLNVTVVQSDRPGQDWAQYVPENGIYDPHTEYLDPRINVELVGFLAQWEYFGHVMRDIVQNHFRFREAIQQDADRFLRRSMAKFHLSPSDVVVIAVHIRRTDLVRRRTKQRRWNDIPDSAYFSHAVAFFNRLFNKKTMYVVCSDDVEWSKVNFVTERPTVFSVGHSADVDFAILSRCNHSILTIGTFGRWSAYMAGGITVYHKRRSPTEVPPDAAYIKVESNEDPRNAWIPLS